MADFNKREQYQADGSVSLAGLSNLVGGAFLAAIGIGWVLKSIFVHRWYLVILAPGVGALLLGATLYLTGMARLTASGRTSLS